MLPTPSPLRLDLPDLGCFMTTWCAGQIVFKTEFGFLTGNPGGLRADATHSTQIEHFFVGKPGKETGLAAKPGLQ